MFFAGESVKKRTTDSINENLTNSDLESNVWEILINFIQF